MAQSLTNDYEVSYFIPRIHKSVSEYDIKFVLMNTEHDTIKMLPFPTRIDFADIPNNKYFKSAFVYHKCENIEDIKIGKEFENLIKLHSNVETKQNFKINCGILTPNNPNAYWILLPNNNYLTMRAKYMTDELKDIGEIITSMLYILSHYNVAIPENIELYLEDNKPIVKLTPNENENFIAEKLYNALKTEEKLLKLMILNNLPLPKDLDLLYKFNGEEDVILTY